MTKINQVPINGNYDKDIKGLRYILRNAYQINSEICCNLKIILDKGRKNNLKFIYPYTSMKNYLDNIKNDEDYEDQWEKIMISPYWNGAKGVDANLFYFFKPKAIKNMNIIDKQIEYLAKIDLSGYEKDFENIARKLPREDRHPVIVAFYPMDEEGVSEGVDGYCCPNSGNILIRINPLIDNYYEWIPFVFAHEYHHCALFSYWYNIKRGKETKGNLLETIINEGQADEFAKSLFKGYEPSWQKGISFKDGKKTWEIFKNVLYESISQDQMDKYMLGSKEDGIPYCAGYYFGSKIVRGFMRKYPNISFKEMIKIPHEIIFNEGIEGW